MKKYKAIFHSIITDKKIDDKTFEAPNLEEAKDFSEGMAIFEFDDAYCHSVEEIKEES